MAEETVAPIEDAAATPARDDVAMPADGAASESAESAESAESVAVAVADAQVSADASPLDTASVQTSAQTSVPTSEADAEPTTITTLEAASAAAPTDGVAMDGSIEPHVTLGRIVHVTLDRGVNTGDCRPAIVVLVWNPEIINAQLFTDGLNDHMDYAGGVVWMTSLHYAKPVAGQPTPPLTWHWSWED